jgi:hypothetical protein
MAKELLTDVTVRNAKPTNKDKRLNDGGGLVTGFICSLNPIGLSGGDLITGSRRVAGTLSITFKICQSLTVYHCQQFFINPSKSDG